MVRRLHHRPHARASHKKLFTVAPSDHSRERMAAAGDWGCSTPVGSHLMAFTSSLWPSKVLRGCVSPSLQTCIILSVLQVAKEVLFFQSTSSVGAAQA